MLIVDGKQIGFPPKAVIGLACRPCWDAYCSLKSSAAVLPPAKPFMSSANWASRSSK